MKQSTAMSAGEQEVAQLIVEALNLEGVKPEEIDPEAPLFQEGLGLDSIDALELALAISRKYGFKLQSDDKQNSAIFRSLRALTEHVAQNRVH
jgi:acyl carrier protein